MSKSIIIGLVAIASLVGVAANAREVCKTISIPTMNCGPNNTNCFVTYTKAQICKQVPDTPKNAATKLTNGVASQGPRNPAGPKFSGSSARTAGLRR